MSGGGDPKWWDEFSFKMEQASRDAQYALARARLEFEAKENRRAHIVRNVASVLTIIAWFCLAAGVFGGCS